MSAFNLVLHCGAKEVSREEVGAVALPATTSSYTPVPHLQLSDIIVDELISRCCVTGPVHISIAFSLPNDLGIRIRRVGTFRAVVILVSVAIDEQCAMAGRRAHHP